MTLLFDSEDARSHIRGRFESRDWWLLLPFGEAGLSLVGAIEKRFYDGDAANDFEAVFGFLPDLGLVSIFLAEKRRMTASQLSHLFRETKGVDLDDLDRSRFDDEHDVVAFGAPLEACARFVYLLNRWLGL